MPPSLPFTHGSSWLVGAPLCHTLHLVFRKLLGSASARPCCGLLADIGKDSDKAAVEPEAGGGVEGLPGNASFVQPPSTPFPAPSPGPTQLMIITLSSGFPTRVPNFNLIARSPPLLSSLLQCSASSSESTRLRGPELARTASLSFSALWRNFPRSVPVLFWSLVRRGREKERKGGGRGKEGDTTREWGKAKEGGPGRESREGETYSTSSRNETPVNENHLEICLSFSQKNRN